MLYKVKSLVAGVFKTHDSLLESLDDYDSENFKLFLKKERDDTDLGLQFLSKLLTRHYGSPCIVLIDEYDSPLECAFDLNSDDPQNDCFQYLSKAKRFFGTFFSSLLKVLRTTEQSYFN
jgi:hypothetical protein